MDRKTLQIINASNHSIIKLRGVYADWSRRHNINYNEMLVLYTIRENGYCTQKQVCDNYLLPRQTIHNVISRMREQGYLILKPEKGEGREKAFVLTEKGRKYAETFFSSLASIEEASVKRFGYEKIQMLTELMKEYQEILASCVEQEAGGSRDGNKQ